ncbi:MAG: serpin family protein [Polyangia bacterium]
MMLSTTLAHADTFATNLYATLAKRPGNLFFSPASVRLALSMTYAGARGETAAQMKKTLELPAGSAAHEAFAAQLGRWNTLANPVDDNAQRAADPSMQKYYEDELARRSIVLSVVNRLWLQRGKHLVADYTQLVRRDYHAGVEQLDFAASEPSRAIINKWVSDATHGKIKTLISPGVLDADTKLVLTNAIYFKASWTSQFQAAHTKQGPFTTSDRPVQVPLMQQVGHFSIADLPTAQVLELPYGDGDLVMDVVLPKKSLADVEPHLASLPSWLGALKPARVDVTLPRWKTTSALELGGPLQGLGMKDAFHYPAADFSGIDGSRDLYISAVVHQAVVEVDEQGTEAAAATAVAMRAGGRPPSDEPVVFRADHPFVYVIRDAKTNAVLFMGRLSNPL